MAVYTSFLICSFVVLASFMVTFAGNFYQDVDIVWGDGRAKILDNGNLITLSLDQNSGSGFQSKNEFLYGKFDMQLKLVPNNSAGTVATFYLHSKDPTSWDEIDFEFLGNLSGDPYLVHTNIYTQGKGNKEQQFYLWFDPTADFHTYTILWNPLHIVFYVDERPIREFKNLEESKGVLYPKTQAMRMYGTLWNGEGWATRGGLVKTDWSQAPFIASYKNYIENACVWSNGASNCNNNTHWFDQDLDSSAQKQLQMVQEKYMVYNYCSDTKRFPQGLPLECNVANFIID